MPASHGPAVFLAVFGLGGAVVAGLWPPQRGPVAVLAADFPTAVAVVERAGGSVTVAGAWDGLVIAAPSDPADAAFALRLRQAGAVAVLDPLGLAGCAAPRS